jgi:hypothetical protein
VHEAGHAVAACAVGLGVKGRGIVVRNVMVHGYKTTSGIAYTRGPGIRTRNSKIKASFNERAIVVSIAGPAAEYRVNPYLVHIDYDVNAIACRLRELLQSKAKYLDRVVNNGEL